MRNCDAKANRVSFTYRIGINDAQGSWSANGSWLRECREYSIIVSDLTLIQIQLRCCSYDLNDLWIFYVLDCVGHLWIWRVQMIFWFMTRFICAQCQFCSFMFSTVSYAKMISQKTRLDRCHLWSRFLSSTKVVIAESRSFRWKIWELINNVLDIFDFTLDRLFTAAKLNRVKKDISSHKTQSQMKHATSSGLSWFVF